ncbi:MAG: patatin-like phospholipase family protein [Verrucomicrobia subdivision 3 bacterium]|nr:patatin-like phospholipase family protein [Limisphaerales bacterium]
MKFKRTVAAKATVMNAQMQLGKFEGDRRRIPQPGIASRWPLFTAPHPDRIVTLASLSRRVPDEFIARTLARRLTEETDGKVLLVHLERGPRKVVLQDWARVAPKVNGEFCFTQQLDFLAPRAERLHVHAEVEESGLLPGMLEHFSQHYHYVIIHVADGAPTPVLLECFGRSDRTFLLLQPTSEDLYQRDLLLRETRSMGKAENVKTIVCREKGEEHFNELLKQMGTSVHGFVHGCPTIDGAASLENWTDREFRDDIRRLAREIAHKRVGLALSSGGARSLAHIGVIQVLEENDIEIDVIAGCSMGAYIGSVWAYGYDGLGMERLAREIEHRWGLLELIDPFILPRQGFLRGEKVKRRLKRSIGDVHFSELVRPLRIVATNLSTLERSIFSSGEVAAAVHASSAIPGACVPVTIDGEQYIDGGIADPLPVDVLEEMGIERIIAINTIPTAAYLRCRHELDRDHAEVVGKRRHKIRAMLNRYLNYFAPGNVLDTILRSFHGAQMRVAEISCLHADVVLRPLSFDGRWHDFRHPGKYIALGRREAEEHLAEVQALVNRKEPTHELESTEHTVATIT